MRQEITNNYLLNILCIDDEFDCENYSDSFTKDMVNSFNDKFVRLSNITDSSMIPHVSFSDLLVLDWNLSKNAVRFKESLNLINDALNQKTPFICVYTDDDINTVINNIEYNFSFYKHFNVLENTSINGFYESVKAICNEIIDEIEAACSSNNDNAVKEIFGKLIREQVLRDELLSFKTELKDCCNEYGFNFEANKTLVYSLYYYGLNCENVLSSCDVNYKLKYTLDDQVLVINNTIIIIFNKARMDDGVKPDEIIEKITDTVTSMPNGDVTLFWMETYVNVLRPIKKEMSIYNSVEEKVLGAYFKRFGPDSINHILKDELDGFLSRRPESRLISEFESGELDFSSLVDKEDTSYFNYLLSSNHLRSVETQRKVWLGDVFYDENDTYYLCITPECDCEHPVDNIDSKFLFVVGHIQNDGDAYLKPESSYYTFANHKGRILPIKWSKLIETFRITEEINDRCINFSGQTVNKVVRYSSSLKPVFANRVKSNVIGNTIRVGINLISMETQDEEG